MRLLKGAYDRVKITPAPYNYNCSMLKINGTLISKWITRVVATNCVLDNISTMISRLCRFKIRKHAFIGMNCYTDDMRFGLLTIGNNVIVSNGMDYACYAQHLGHYPINIEDGKYIRMKANVININVRRNWKHNKIWTKYCDRGLYLKEQKRVCWSYRYLDSPRSNREKPVELYARLICEVAT